MPRNPTVLVYTWAQLPSHRLLNFTLVAANSKYASVANSSSDKHAANDDSEATLHGRGGGTATATRSRYRHRAPTRARKDLEDLEAAEKADVSSIQQGM
ncbi:hypothetical protein MY4824_008425 [Beauveria thailandica]